MGITALLVGGLLVGLLLGVVLIVAFPAGMKKS